MAIANGTCVSFCNQPKAQFGYLSRVTPICRCLLPFCGWRHLATSRESKAHFGLPGYAPVIIAVIFTWMERGFNARQTYRSMYAYIFNRFPVIQPVISKVRHFSTFLHVFAYPGYAPGTIAVNVTWMETGFNAGQTHSSIYPSIFNRLRYIGRKVQLLPTPLHLTPPLGCSHWISGKKFGSQKTRIMGLPGSEDSLTIGWAVSTQYQRVTDGQTDRRRDRRTDGRPAYNYNVHQSSGTGTR